MTFAPNETPSVKLGSSLLEVDAISVHPDGGLVAVSCGGVLHLLAWPSLRKLGRSKDSGGNARYSSDGSILIGTGPASVSLHDPRKATPIRQIFGGTFSVDQVAFSPDGKRLVVGEAKRALVLDIASGEQVLEFKVFDRTVRRVAWSPDGRSIATRSWQDAGVFDASTGALLGALPGLSDEHGDIVFSPTGAVLTSVDELSVGVWTAGSWGEPARRIATAGRSRSIAASAQLIALEDRGSIALLTTELEPVGRVSVDDEIFSLALSTDGSALLAGVGPALFAWSSAPGARPAKVTPPAITVKIAGARSAERDVDFRSVGWLSSLCAPLPAATKVKPLAKLDAWPGPDAEGVASFLEFIQTLEDDLGTAARSKGVGLPDDAYPGVFALAARKVPYDKNADWATPASAAPLVVATIARIVERYRALDWELPETVATLWAWCLDGRWPCGFDRKPGTGALQLLVV